jgi:small subunit ribosomal protein S16
MPVKIRLARHGRKQKPFYYIVAADSRAPRDGRYIERIGSYNPNTDPATIDLNFDKALTWLRNGAVPTDTCRAILSYNGVLYKQHLLKGITKGALTEEQAEAKFQDWLKAKQAKIQAKKDRLAKEAHTDKSSKLDAETEVNKKRAEELAKKRAKALKVEDQAVVEDTTVEAQTDEQVEEKTEE